jgi:hypothetical protein
LRQARRFVDPSGGSADSFTAAIAHKDADCLILLDGGSRDQATVLA